MFEELDDPTPPTASMADRDAVGRRAAALRQTRLRQQRALLGVAALIPIVAAALVFALLRRDDETDVSTDSTATSEPATTTTSGTTTSGATATSTPVVPPATPSTSTTAPSGSALAMQYVSDIDATTASSVWAVGTQPCGADRCASLAHSSDGGATWAAAGVPAGLKAESPNHVRFGSASDGYLYGQQLWITHDGAKTWFQPGGWPAAWASVLALEPEGDDVWGVVSTCPQRTSGCGLTLIVSSDAGDSWTAAAPQAPGLTGTAATLVREADGHAWILSSDESGPSPQLVTTADGGATWKPLTVPCTLDYTVFADLAVVDPSHLWLACASDPATIQQLKPVYSSADGGATWTAAADSGLFAHLASIAAPVAGTVFMALERGGLITTSTGASAWADAVPATDVCDAGLSRVLFVDPHHGWASGGEPGCQHAVVWRTTDGGATWRGVPLG
jgi:hypothetical protein